MNHIFRLGEAFLVPDGTLVREVLAGPHDVNLSVAAGEIPPHTQSKIHLHPCVTQVTWVLSGALTVRMKVASASDSDFTLRLAPDESVVSRPGTFFQLINDGDALCRVLYIVQPAFLFVVDPTGRVVYNDAIVLDEDWSTLAANGWPQPDPAPLHAARRRHAPPTG
jgi:mannose-6-phosphate isomerase-like protein (cupin superfamily)